MRPKRFSFKVVLLFIFPFVSQSVRAQITFVNFAVTDVTIIDANHQKPLAHQTVVIKGNSIKEIFTDGSKSLSDSVSIINLKGKYLIPSLIDTHVNMATDPSGVDNHANTLDVLQRMLYSGITSVQQAKYETIIPIDWSCNWSNDHFDFYQFVQVK